MQWDGVHALVQRAQAGDRDAWPALVAFLQPYLTTLAARLLGPGWPEKSVSDLSQTTLLRAWEKIQQFKGGADDAQTGALLRAWLGKIVRNLHKNDLRFASAQRRKQPKGSVPIDPAEDSSSPGDTRQPTADDSTPSTQLRREEVRTLVQQALATLAERDRRIVQLVVFDNLSFRQAAEQLGLDESTVRYHFNRILKRLGANLGSLK